MASTTLPSPEPRTMPTCGWSLLFDRTKATASSIAWIMAGGSLSCTRPILAKGATRGAIFGADRIRCDSRHRVRALEQQEVHPLEDGVLGIAPADHRGHLRAQGRADRATLRLGHAAAGALGRGADLHHRGRGHLPGGEARGPRGVPLRLVCLRRLLALVLPRLQPAGVPL